MKDFLRWMATMLFLAGVLGLDAVGAVVLLTGKGIHP